MPLDHFQRLTVDTASITVLQLLPAGCQLTALNQAAGQVR